MNADAPKAKIDFIDYYKKNLANSNDDSYINSNLPDLLDK